MATVEMLLDLLWWIREGGHGKHWYWALILALGLGGAREASAGGPYYWAPVQYRFVYNSCQNCGGEPYYSPWLNGAPFTDADPCTGVNLNAYPPGDGVETKPEIDFKQWSGYTDGHAIVYVDFLFTGADLSTGTFYMPLQVQITVPGQGTMVEDISCGSNQCAYIQNTYWSFGCPPSTVTTSTIDYESFLQPGGLPWTTTALNNATVSLIVGSLNQQDPPIWGGYWWTSEVTANVVTSGGNNQHRLTPTAGRTWGEIKAIYR